MTKDEIYNELTEVFREVFQNENLVISPATKAQDVEG
jgi:hypothetical protein